MSHFLIVPINENGVINDENISTELTLGCSTRFGITDVFCYSHGWWTTAIRAVAQYNRFSIEFVDRTLEIAAKEPPKALGIQFPLAHRINLFAKNHDRVAMGFTGPTDATKQAFGGCYDLTVKPGFSHADYAPPAGTRLVNADITPLHEANVGYPTNGFGGHHSDIYIRELYELIAAFLFR